MSVCLASYDTWAIMANLESLLGSDIPAFETVQLNGIISKQRSIYITRWIIPHNNVCTKCKALDDCLNLLCTLIFVVNVAYNSGIYYRPLKPFKLYISIKYDGNYSHTEKQEGMMNCQAYHISQFSFKILW